MRLSHIAHDLKDVVERYRPDTAAVESIYFGANVRSAIPTAHARGAALVALSECALEIGEYTPMQIKQALTGYGKADKRQMQQVTQFKKLESRKLPVDFDYSTVKSLRNEAVQKLNLYQPLNIGQASRISGVSPADISVLMVYLEQAGRR